MISGSFHLRLATPADVPTLRELIAASVRTLQANDYSSAQLESALRTVYGADSQLIADGTYLVAETGAETAAEFHSTKNAPLIVGCGGWSKRKTLYGGDQWNAREDSLLDPVTDAAKIRAFFIHPDWVRRGIGTLILKECERAAVGFTRFEMGATLTGVAMYKASGYVAMKDMAVPLEDGLNLPIVHMAKTI